MNARMTATVVPLAPEHPSLRRPPSGPGGDCLLFTPSLRGTAAPPHYAPAVGLLRHLDTGITGFSRQPPWVSRLVLSFAVPRR
jgi:hypothetical protein